MSEVARESKSVRMAHLLGELRREMNGAVVGSMRYYGGEYGLNYGVSIPTIRTMGRAESEDHIFARYLYQQEVRELKLISLWIASPEMVGAELDFWSRGIVNSEIAEEAAFVLMGRVDGIEEWLNSESELLQYCAVLALAAHDVVSVKSIAPQLISLLKDDPHLLPKAVVSMLDCALRNEQSRQEVVDFMAMVESQLPNDLKSVKYICEEMAWRLSL